jgi:hypothetical protein
MDAILARFSPAWPATRHLLHGFATALALVPRRYAAPHPRWWHVGLTIGPEGATTVPVPLPGGGVLVLRLDLVRHVGSALLPEGERVIADLRYHPVDRFLSELGHLVDSLGLPIDSAMPVEFAGAGPYDEGAAASAGRTLSAVARALEHHAASRPGATGPVHLWPHNFDLSTEWFPHRGTVADRKARDEPRITLGFDPAATDQYFYSSPWPFTPTLLDQPLPEGATWHTEGWTGAILPFETVADGPDGLDRVARFAEAVERIAAPTLGES